MTKEEGVGRLLAFCDATMDSKGWVRTKDSNLTYKTTRLLQDYEKTANLRLPEELQLNCLTIDKTGITDRSLFKFEWKDICATAFKIRFIKDGRHDPGRHDHYLLVCLQNGEVMQFFIGEVTDLSHMHGLTGHFIEQYKLQYTAEHDQE